jgi:hypothetical protein
MACVARSAPILKDRRHGRAAHRLVFAFARYSAMAVLLKAASALMSASENGTLSHWPSL